MCDSHPEPETRFSQALAQRESEKRTGTPGILLLLLLPQEGTLSMGPDMEGGSQDPSSRQTQLHAAAPRPQQDASPVSWRFSQKGVRG